VQYAAYLSAEDMLLPFIQVEVYQRRSAKGLWGFQVMPELVLLQSVSEKLFGVIYLLDGFYTLLKFCR
jgi:hypothetical protein